MSSEAVQYPSSVDDAVYISYLPANIRHGLFSYETNVTWMVNGGSLYAINQKNGQIIQMWQCKFGEIYYVYEMIHGSSQFLVVAVYANMNTHIIGLLDASSLNVVKLMYLANKVTSITVVELLPTNRYSSQVNPLLSFSGMIAIGCKGGNAYVINLNLDEDFSSDEPVLEPLPMKVVDKHTSEEKIYDISNTGHAAIVLLKENIDGGKFIYKNLSLSASEVSIPAIQFAKQIASLFIGYSFGSFVIYSLSSLSITYTSPCSSQLSSPVNSFMYLEPENDPKYFIYVWVARGSKKNAVVSSSVCETKLTLYQMVYSTRSVTRGETRYDGFQSCTPRMEYPLTASPTAPSPRGSASSVLLKCFPIKHFRKSSDMGSSLCIEEDLSVSAFVWLAHVNGHPKNFIAFFDINQWYQAQMPNCVRWKKSGKHTGILGCSYFAFFSLDQFIGDDHDILDLLISDVSPFISHPPLPETHLWPSSLKFRVAVLRKQDILSCTFLGLPRLALHELDDCRKVLYAHPEEVFNLCVKADLVHLEWEDDSQLMNIQKKCILNILMDLDCPARILTAFVESWLSCGANDPIILEWVTEKCNDVMKEKDSICCSLKASQNPQVLRLEQFVSMQKLFDKIVLQVSGVQHGICDELLERCHYVNLQLKVIEVLLFCIANGCFNMTFLGSLHTLSCCCETRNHHDCNVQLGIDHLSTEFQVIDFVYPPNSVAQFLNIFMSSNLKAVHSYILYLLYDIESLQITKFANISSLYAITLCLPSEVIQGTKLLWMTDHQVFERTEFDGDFCSLFSEETLFEWQHKLIADKLLRNGCKDLALKYLFEHGEEMQTIDEVKLKIAIFIANKKILSGYNIVDNFKESEYHEELFQELLKTCHQGEVFHLILGLKLSDIEEVVLMKYISKLNQCDLNEMLVYYYLLDHRTSEAALISQSQEEVDSCLEEPLLYQREVANCYIHQMTQCSVELNIQKEEVSSTSKTVLKFGESLSTVVGRQMKSEAVTSRVKSIYRLLQSRYDFQSSPIIRASFPNFIATMPDLSRSGVILPEVHTPIKKETHKLPKKCIASMNDTSFCAFRSCIHEFRDHISSKKTMLPTSELSISSPISVDTLVSDKQQRVVTPSSILKYGTKEHSEVKTIRFAKELPKNSTASKSRDVSFNFLPMQLPSTPSESTSVSLQNSNSSDIFLSPVEHLNLTSSYLQDESEIMQTEVKTKCINEEKNENELSVGTPNVYSSVGKEIQGPHCQLDSASFRNSEHSLEHSTQSVPDAVSESLHHSSIISHGYTPVSKSSVVKQLDTMSVSIELGAPTSSSNSIPVTTNPFPSFDPGSEASSNMLISDSIQTSLSFCQPISIHENDKTSRKGTLLSPYAFSPPLTRSAAKRKTLPVAALIVGKTRPKIGKTSSKETPITDPGVVLVSPPSVKGGASVSGNGKRSQYRKLTSEKSAVSVRRSARLLRGKK